MLESTNEASRKTSLCPAYGARLLHRKQVEATAVWKPGLHLWSRSLSITILDRSRQRRKHCLLWEYRMASSSSSSSGENWWTGLKHFVGQIDITGCQLSCTVSLHLPFLLPQQLHFQCLLSPLTLFFVFLFPSQPTNSQRTCYIPWHCSSQLPVQHLPLPAQLLPFALLLLLWSPSWDLIHNAKTGCT